MLKLPDIEKCGSFIRDHDMEGSFNLKLLKNPLILLSVLDALFRIVSNGFVLIFGNFKRYLSK